MDIGLGPNLAIFEIKPNFGRGEVEQGSPPEEPVQGSSKFVQIEEKALEDLMSQAAKGDLYDEMIKSNGQLAPAEISVEKGKDVMWKDVLTDSEEERLALDIPQFADFLNSVPSTFEVGESSGQGDSEAWTWIGSLIFSYCFLLSFLVSSRIFSIVSAVWLSNLSLLIGKKK